MQLLALKFEFSNGKFYIYRRYNCSDEPYIVSPGCICIIRPLSKLNKRMKADGELWIFTGKYYNYNVSGKSASIGVLIRRLGAKGMGLISYKYLVPKELFDVNKLL